MTPTISSFRPVRLSPTMRLVFLSADPPHWGLERRDGPRDRWEPSLILTEPEAVKVARLFHDPDQEGS